MAESSSSTSTRRRDWHWPLPSKPATAIVLVLRFFYTSESPMWSATYEGPDHAAEIIKKTYYLDEVLVRQDQRQARRGSCGQVRS